MIRRRGKALIRYQIVVLGELSDSQAAVFENLSVETENGGSVITADVVDQSQLHGILGWLRDVGVEIVSLRLSEEGTDDQPQRVP